MNEKIYKIYYGDNENDYIRRFLKEEDILDGYLTEAKAFDLFYSDMIMSNNYLQNNYENLEFLIDSYDEEEDYYVDEYQVFIINLEFDEDLTIKATEKMGNTLYYDTKNEIYLTGITDLGTMRTYVPTRLKVIEDKEIEK
jgi:hypothetical protein